MKTINNSDKFSEYSNTVHCGNYNSQYPQSTGHKKSATMKKFQYCISANTTQTIKVPLQNHFNYLNDLNMTHKMIPPKKPTQKPIHNVQKNITVHFVTQYQKIINNLTHYFQYYEWLLTKQIEKHDHYFNEIIKIVQNEKKKSRFYLVEQLKTLEQKISLQKAALQNKISLLQNNNLKPYEKEKIQLQTQKVLQIPLFQINLKSLDKFKSELKHYLFQTVNKQNLQKQQQNDRSLSQSIKTVKTQPNQKKQSQIHSQIDDITPIHIPEQGLKSITIEDQDLYCDQDIQNILKQNPKQKKKRYQCQQDPIPEQSESHQDSLVMSNLDILN